MILDHFNTMVKTSLRAFILITTQILERKNVKMKFKFEKDFTFSLMMDGFISTIGNKKCIGETIQLGTGIDFSMKQTSDEIKKLQNKNKIVQDKERMRPKKVRLID